MLEHQKMVLRSVSFDKALFRKELIKCLSYLNEREQHQMVKWLKENFAQTHTDVLKDVFYPKFNYAS